MRNRFNEHGGDTPLNDPMAGTRCQAHGCPNRWSVDVGAGRLCHWHDVASPHLWPIVTQEQLEAQTDRAARVREPVAPPMTREQKVDAIDRLRIVADRLGKTPADPQAWAKNLQAKRDRGIRLSSGQRGALAEYERHHPYEVRTLGPDGDVKYEHFSQDDHG